MTRLDELGEEPDARFTLANERTFLAWNRTALALLAAGLAVAEFLRSQPSGVRLAIAAPLMLLGAAVALQSYGRWRAVQQALRLGRPLPASGFSQLLSGGIALIAVFACVLVLIHQ